MYSGEMRMRTDLQVKKRMTTMKNITQLFFGLLIAILFASCSSYSKIPYYQNLDRKQPSVEEISNYSPLTIQPEDILAINVSSLNPQASAVFNYNLITVNGAYNATPDNPVTGYLVDQKGEIKLPLVGHVRAAGLSTAVLSEQITKKLLPLLKDPVVNIRILNFKVSVMGDVGRPGVFQIQNERITLPEALTLAGDLNITAKRGDILLIRERDGKRTFMPIDLKSKDLFNSPYYYLKNNDVIYVQPGRAKYASENSSYRNLSLALSALSIVAIVLTRN
jgi:polysaccharide export outer membrane protein